MDGLKFFFPLILLLLFFLLSRCNVESGSETFKFERDTPDWLKTKIDSISNSALHYYDMTKIYRYKGDESFIYHFSHPLNSCKYCELYNQMGEKISAFNDTALHKVLMNKTNEVLIWENKK